MDDDPLSGSGLNAVELTDQATFDSYFKSLNEPLSDYTFSQIYTWRKSLRILWKIIRGNLCIFANGTGDLTLLMPPIGDGGAEQALAQAWEIMDDYNADHGVPGNSRVEYTSEELLARVDSARLRALPMGTDYLYDVRKMIELPGGDLASKRQAKNRFMRNYNYRVELYDKSRHMEGCRALLHAWKDHQDVAHSLLGATNALKRQKESMAALMALEDADRIGLRGLVVLVSEDSIAARSLDAAQHGPSPAPLPQPADADGFSIRGFTFGELLGADQSSIVIEKTDLAVKGLAQFIFSEFCRTHWANRPLVNVGDDWGLPTLAWTKLSYRPAKLLQKYSLSQAPRVQISVPGADSSPAACASAGGCDYNLPYAMTTHLSATIRSARKDDLDAAVELEQKCFSAHTISKRQMQYLQGRPSAVFLVAEQQGKVIGEGIALVRRHKTGRPSGRIYSLAVAAEARGQKIGQRLMKQMVKELVDRGVKRVYLEVEKNNLGAVRLYEALGFQSIGELRDYYAAGSHALHMMCEVPVTPTLFTQQPAGV